MKDLQEKKLREFDEMYGELSLVHPGSFGHAKIVQFLFFAIQEAYTKGAEDMKKSSLQTVLDWKKTNTYEEDYHRHIFKTTVGEIYGQLDALEIK